MFALSELEQKVQAMRPKLDAKYSKIAPVTWDVEKKDRDLRFNEDYVYTFDDGRKVWLVIKFTHIISFLLTATTWTASHLPMGS